jgi:hypothetical protein
MGATRSNGQPLRQSRRKARLQRYDRGVLAKVSDGLALLDTQRPLRDPLAFPAYLTQERLREKRHLRAVPDQGSPA